MPTGLLSDLFWKRAGVISLEHFRLLELPAGYALQGVLLSEGEVCPQQICYRVVCDPAWVTRSVHVAVIEGIQHCNLELERDRSGAWRRGAEVLPDFHGIADIDLQITPATNTLPIQRLKLRVGEAAETDALWVRFPDLSLQRLPQRYTRQAEHRYLYESRGGSFKAQLDVDAEGVVLRYGDIWTRVAG